MKIMVDLEAIRFANNQMQINIFWEDFLRPQRWWVMRSGIETVLWMFKNG